MLADGCVKEIEPNPKFLICQPYEAGILEITKLFGEDEGKVARQNIISDLKQEGWNDREHSFPRDENHYVEMGLY